ncbi:uracil-DNA glycosylase family protein [Parashewanella spongiae]|uniref:Uracil-DNA glycosylase family protein n=1 Tax=Parashewanella spongiae TaxID=342950 RepID=A0A3A6U509_9GAMM|nr:uracil-DNA glycosylase family protein [Parashewanella spongiae]MCL1078080.1 uracil-DNA glycosylase family protein [Parashewanella spongiae]RJY16953.1 uracil-DNA glycosylase family protein [Parashewanella spongiae]
MVINKFSELLEKIQSCRHCEDHLPCPPKPVLQVHPDAKILIAGQAPGRKVQESCIPFDDASGDKLRRWLGVDKKQFYNEKQFAIVPMGFCFPGTSKQGDLPPRPECAAQWRQALLAQLPNIQLTLVIGQYAQQYHFGGKKMSVTDRVKQWKDYTPSRLALPHPSPRNIRWFQSNPWFDEQVIPYLQLQVQRLLNLGG